MTAGRFEGAVRGLAPAYFALVMATGIISVGLELVGRHVVSTVLLWIAIVAFAGLVVLNALRLVRHRDAIASDLRDPGRAFGFYTLIAAMNVVGVRLAMDGHTAWAAALLAVSTAIWLVLGYAVPWLVLGAAPRPIIATANGGWFNWVVASQSVAVSAATLEPVYDEARALLGIVALFAWSVGFFLYAAAGIFVALRMMVYEFRPVDLTPPYWVAMGALAISILAGAKVVDMTDAPMVDVMRGLVAGLAVMAWAFASWLIPALVAAGWWRHVRHRVALVYEADLWSIIFPLGMYAVAGIHLGQADDIPIVGAIGSSWIWVAVFAWLLTATVMVGHVVRTVWPRLLPEGHEAG